MGLLDYYKQFAGMSEAEVSFRLKAKAEHQRSRALARIEAIDLSRTTWHELPHADVVAAVTFAARGGLNDPPDAYAVALRRELAGRCGLEVERVVAGNGAAELLGAAAGALLGPGDELVTPWPSYALYPSMARRAGARAVPVLGGFDPERLLAAVNDSTRVVVICNPNDPDGAYLRVPALRALLEALPERVTVLLDEALGDYVDAEPPGGTLELLDDFPRLVAFRTLSKAYGLAGLRCGWALGGLDTAPLLERIVPELGLSSPAQAGALEALRKCGPLVAARREVVRTERRRLLDTLPDLPVDAPPSQANVVWLRARGLTGVQLETRLRSAGVIVAPGSALGDLDHVRAQVQGPVATDRLLEALGRVTG